MLTPPRPDEDADNAINLRRHVILTNFLCPTNHDEQQLPPLTIAYAWKVLVQENLCRYRVGAIEVETLPHFVPRKGLSVMC